MEQRTDGWTRSGCHVERDVDGRAVLDEVDRDILEVLAEDARISNVDLAARVGLSPSPCLRRVRRLEEAGVLLGYRAVIAPEHVERGLTVWAAIRMRIHERGLVAEVERSIANLPGVTEVHHVAGDQDYLLRVEVADLQAYDRFTGEVLPRVPGIGHVTSFVVLRTMRDDDRAIVPRSARGTF